LRDHGYEVIEATNANAAIKTLQSRVHVDAVLSDIKMRTTGYPERWASESHFLHRPWEQADFLAQGATRLC